MCGRAVLGIPIPVSRTSSTALVPWFSTRSSIDPPDGVYLIALSRRLTTTCFSSDGFPTTITLEETRYSRRMHFSSASNRICSAVEVASSQRFTTATSLVASPASSLEISSNWFTILVSRAISSSALPTISNVWGDRCSYCVSDSSLSRRMVGGGRDTCDTYAGQRRLC